MLSKKLLVNAALAFVAAFVGAISVSGGAITKPVLIAAAWAAIRVAVGVVAAAVGRPVPVDQ